MLATDCGLRSVNALLVAHDQTESLMLMEYIADGLQIVKLLRCDRASVFNTCSTNSHTLRGIVASDRDVYAWPELRTLSKGLQRRMNQFLHNHAESDHFHP